MNKVESGRRKNRKNKWKVYIIIANCRRRRKSSNARSKVEDAFNCLLPTPKKLTLSLPRRVNMDTHHPTTACPHRRHDANFSAPAQVSKNKSSKSTSTIDYPLSTKHSKKEKITPPRSRICQSNPSSPLYNRRKKD
jgi:hypothetical protein